MRIIEQLVYKITGDNSEFDKSIDKSETKVSKFGSVADKMLAGVTVAAIGMVVKKMGDMVISSANALDRVDKLSQKIGLSRVAFQEWDYILGQSGASVEGLQMGLKTLSGAADEAMKGTQQYKESFDRLGVSVTDTNGKMKDQETLFAEVFSALADMENQTERTALASDLLGRSATELAPTLNTSKEAIEGLRQEAHDLGLVYSDELVDAGVVLGDNIDRLKKSFDAFKTNALSPIIGLAVTFTDKLLGQNTASKNLKTTYDTLQTAVTNYNTILDTSKGKTDAITQSMVSQAKAQMQLALQSASESYRKSSSELEKYSNTIQNSEKWISKYDKTLGQIAQSTGYTTEQLNLMTEQERLTAIAMAKGVEEGDRYNTIVLARKRYQEDLIKATTNLSQAEANQESFINLLTQGYISNNSSTKLLLDTYPELEQKVLNNVEAYEKEQKAIADRNKAIQLATTAFKAYENASQETLERIINLNRANKDSAYNTELVRLATEKLNEVLAEKARLAETEAEKEEARAEIIANTNKAISDAEKVSIALGDAYDLTSAKAGIFTSAIETLIESGLEPSSKEVQEFVTQLNSLAIATEVITDANKTSIEIIEEYNKKQKQLRNTLSVTNDTLAYYGSLKRMLEESLIDMLNNEISKTDEGYQALARSLKTVNALINSMGDDTKNVTSERLSLLATEEEAFLFSLKKQSEAYLEQGYELAEIDAWKEKQKEEFYANIDRLAQEEADKELARKQKELEEEEKLNQQKLDLIASQAKERADAYKLLESYRQTDHEKAITAIQTQAQAFLQAGVDRVDVAKWQSEQIQALIEDEKFAWVDYSMSIASSIASMWNNINRIRENNHEEELNRMKEEGASQEEIDERKKELAREDLKRKKAQGTFQAIIDTASAIIGFLANPGGWAGIGLSAMAGITGATQIAAIQSEPLPAFEVGSIRIPETQQAVVHRNEMILPAPIAEQARQEGISIAPSGGGSGNTTFLIYLDGKKIAENTVGHVNSGVYRIDARVVK